MTQARAYALFYPEAGRTGHMFDFFTSYVSFSPGSYEELETLDATIWRYLYPYQILQDIHEVPTCKNE